jgi:hypothetical protein
MDGKRLEATGREIDRHVGRTRGGRTQRSGLPRICIAAPAAKLGTSRFAEKGFCKVEIGLKPLMLERGINNLQILISRFRLRMRVFPQPAGRLRFPSFQSATLDENGQSDGTTICRFECQDGFIEDVGRSRCPFCRTGLRPWQRKAA